LQTSLPILLLTLLQLWTFGTPLGFCVLLIYFDQDVWGWMYLIFFFLYLETLKNEAVFSCIFASLLQEYATSPKMPGLFYYKIILETKILNLDIHIGIVV
jgi:hypothetical protein